MAKGRGSMVALSVASQALGKVPHRHASLIHATRCIRVPSSPDCCRGQLNRTIFADKASLCPRRAGVCTKDFSINLAR